MSGLYLPIVSGLLVVVALGKINKEPVESCTSPRSGELNPFGNVTYFKPCSEAGKSTLEKLCTKFEFKIEKLKTRSTLQITRL